jgi:ribosome-binding factor A
MPSKIRVKRIADRIFQDFSEMLIYELNDPRLAGVNVTDVEVDRELSYADIYVSSLAGEVSAEETLAGLQNAAGFIRRQLAKSLQLRSFPQVRFHWDPTPERADRIDQLLATIRETDDDEDYDDEVEEISDEDTE